MMNERLNQLQGGCPHKDNFDYHSGYQQALIDVELSLDDAYLAGIFDGEGCIYKHPSGKTYLNMTNTSKETCERLRKRFGGSVVQHPPGCWRWVATGKAAYKMAIATLPFLTIKKAKMIVVLDKNFGLRDAIQGDAHGEIRASHNLLEL